MLCTTCSKTSKKTSVPLVWNVTLRTTRRFRLLVGILFISNVLLHGKLEVGVDSVPFVQKLWNTPKQINDMSLDRFIVLFFFLFGLLILIPKFQFLFVQTSFCLFVLSSSSPSVPQSQILAYQLAVDVTSRSNIFSRKVPWVRCVNRPTCVGRLKFIIQPLVCFPSGLTPLYFGSQPNYSVTSYVKPGGSEEDSLHYHSLNAFCHDSLFYSKFVIRVR